MPALPDLPIFLLIYLPAAVSVTLWLRYFTFRSKPFWALERSTPPPEFSTTLFMAGGFLLFVGVLFDVAIRPGLVNRFAGPLPGNAEEFDLQRRLVATQVSVVMNLVTILLASVVIWRQSAEQRRRVGFRRDDLRGQAFFGVQGFFLALLPVYLLVLMVSPLKQSEEALHPLLRLLAAGKDDLRFVVWPCLSAILIAPLQEELLYRVLIQQGLVSLGYRVKVAIVGVALFFCFAHLFPDSIPLFPLAVLLGLVMHYRNSFLAVVLMHMLFNAFNILLTIFGSSS